MDEKLKFPIDRIPDSYLPEKVRQSELVETRRNWDSLTLVFPRKKVHIEQIAILSPELRKHLGGRSFNPSGSL